MNPECPMEKNGTSPAFSITGNFSPVFFTVMAPFAEGGKILHSNFIPVVFTKCVGLFILQADRTGCAIFL